MVLPSLDSGVGLLSPESETSPIDSREVSPVAMGEFMGDGVCAVMLPTVGLSRSNTEESSSRFPAVSSGFGLVSSEAREAS